jgi:hypothetical protein
VTVPDFSVFIKERIFDGLPIEIRYHHGETSKIHFPRHGDIDNNWGFPDMPRFRVGDRVQVVGDIARFYSCIVGVVISNADDPASVLNQHRVRLADDVVALFFDFQLYIPPSTSARVIFDSLVTTNSAGTRGETAGRHVHLAGRDIDIHLKIQGSTPKAILGQITAGANVMRKALVTLLVQDEVTETIATDESGEFALRDVSSGSVSIEIFVPARRVLASLTV